jgi:hypothetical protein
MLHTFGMDSGITIEQQRRLVQQWRITGPLLEEFKKQELRAMTDEEARAISEMLLSPVPSPHDWRPDPQSSGLVEQQRIFRRALEK